MAQFLFERLSRIPTFSQASLSMQLHFPMLKIIFTLNARLLVHMNFWIFFLMSSNNLPADFTHWNFEVEFHFALSLVRVCLMNQPLVYTHRISIVSLREIVPNFHGKYLIVTFNAGVRCIVDHSFLRIQLSSQLFIILLSDKLEVSAGFFTLLV